MSHACMCNSDEPLSARLRAMIHREERARAEHEERIEGAVRAAHDARVITRALAWKLNFVLVGVGATFVAVGTLIAWTVVRVDQIEIRARSAAIVDARAAAIDAVRGEMRAMRPGP